MKQLAALIAFASLAMAASSACAQDRLANPMDDYFRLTAGLFSATATTDARLDATDETLGTELSGEDDFGLRSRSEIANIEAELHPRKRHKLRFGYFKLDRRATSPLERNILFGDDLYVLNDVVHSRLSVSDFNMGYTYYFARRERFELGANINLHLFQFEGSANVPARFIENSTEDAGPLPSFGLEGTVRITRRFHAEFAGEYLQATVQDTEVGLLNYRARLFFRFNQNISAGVGYNSMHTNFDFIDEGESGLVRLDNRGAELLFRVSF